MADHTLAEQQPAFDALAAIFRAFSHLPPAHVQLSPIYPNQVDISLHDSLGDFEAWREALGITPDAVERKDLPSNLSLQATGEFTGAQVHLTGFAPLYAVAEALTGRPSGGVPAGRCGAAHAEDLTPCEGPRDAVRIVGQTGTEALGCVHHAARTHASVDHARVYPQSVPSAAIEVYRRAQDIRPFAWQYEGGAA